MPYSTHQLCMWNVTASVLRAVGSSITILSLVALIALPKMDAGQEPLSAAPPVPLVASDGNIEQIDLSVTSNLVVVPVTVTDGKGRVVDGLRREHFSVYDDKVGQDITHFSSEDMPVSIGLIVDTSESMDPKLQKARQAVTALLSHANPEDEFFLVQFNSQPTLTVNFTNRTEEIRKDIGMIEARGKTALLDAIALGVKTMRNSRHVRKAMIIISDGEDNSSHYSVESIMESVRQSDVLIYGIWMTDSAYSGNFQTAGSQLLQAIAKPTGGSSFQVAKPTQLPGVASKIGLWLRHQYVLAYTPGAANRNDGYHQIRVTIKRPDGFPRLRVSWRLGYYIPAQ